MSADTLRPILAAYRAEVQPHWSAETAHPDYEGAAGSPVGQCGVTSAWLQRRLAEDHGVEAHYTLGILRNASNYGVEHVWLDLGAWPDSLVLDLTADQDPKFGLTSVVCTGYSDLFREGADYIPERYLSLAETLRNPVRERLAILTEAVGR